MQLYILSPLPLILMKKRPKQGVALIIFLILVGIIIDFVIAYVYKFQPSLLGNAAAQNYQQSHIYLPTHARFVPWLMGLILGYIIHQTRERPLKLSKLAIVSGWVAAIFVSVGSQNSPYHLQQLDYVYNRLQCSFFFALFRAGWTLGIAWVIFACVSGYGGSYEVQSNVDKLAKRDCD
uniref:Uncharacterized protein n=1 Tax=Timema cristinae TaxID=61476 RepID=A0A7R9DH31_TIMCR|nr:unnamed protein product [Timema cristinae]